MIRWDFLNYYNKNYQINEKYSLKKELGLCPPSHQVQVQTIEEYSEPLL